MLLSTKQAAELLLSKDRILVLCHMNPDGDTLSAAFALQSALSGMDKQVRVACSDPLPERFSYLYREYRPTEFEPEYIVAVDVATPTLLGPGLAEYADKVDLCIDHHSTNTLYAKETCLRMEAAATCEVMFDILHHHMDATITPHIADCLYTGIATDTGCFRFSNTTTYTHTLAARLFGYGASFVEINRDLFETKSKSRILVEREVLDSMEFYCEDKVALIVVTQEMIRQYEADESELEGLSGIPRSIEGVELGLTLREKPDGIYKISARTARYMDASRFCGRFGGGGHKFAAGCALQGTVDEVKRQLIAAAEELFSEQETEEERS